MTMKSCFYPLIGDKIFGWMGDFIDIISVLTTLFGVCTSLGLGTRQLNAGFNVFNSDIDPDDITIQVNIQLYLSFPASNLIPWHGRIIEKLTSAKKTDIYPADGAIIGFTDF